MIDSHVLALAAGMAPSLARALVITVIVEIAVARLAFGVRTARALGIIALANAVTNPVLNVLLAGFMGLTASTSLTDPPTALALAGLEGTAAIAEWLFIARALHLPKRRALALSLAMNAASLVAGLLLLA